MENVSSGKIGRYEIIRVLGRGGMGEVVLAQDQNLGRRVAIKRPFKSAQADGLARFQVEAKAATLRHPNIPAVYEMGVHEDLPFIAMEYVEGETLEKIIESKQEVDLITKLSIIEQVCSALGYAHDNGIIHRDIKPANIIVQPDGTAKIIDFGIAKLADNDPNSGLTKASQLIGSLHYIAPERFYGGGKTDGRVDIFSAGVTLFELLTGKEPFTGGEATASFKIMNEAVTGLGQYLHDYPPALDEIIGKSLAKNPDDRYQTGEDFADALHEVIEELKHSRVSELFNDAERLTTERRFAPALELLDEAIKLDPAHTQARKLRKFVREHQERVRRAERLRECLLKSDEALLNGNFEEALNQLKDAWSLDQASVEIKNKIRELEEKKRRFEISAKALAEADKAKVRGDVTGALRIVTKGLEDDPENKKLLALNAALGRQMEIEAQRGRLLELQENAARALAVRDYDSADKFLGEAVAIDPSNPETDKLRRELARARELEQRRAVLEEIQLRANEFMRNDAYEQASDLLHRALERLPHETLLHRLKAEVDAEARKYDVRHIVDLAIAQANELFVNSPFEALAVLQKALDNIPGEERLVAYERSLRQQLETQRSEQLRAETVIKARELMTGRQFGKAIAVLESFQVEFGQNSDVDELLTFARDELVRQQRTEAVSRTLSEARTLIRDGRLDEAVRLLETGQEQTGDASVGALLAESRDQLAATARNLEALFKYVEQLRERDELDEAILLLQDQLAATPGNGNLQQLATSLFAERKQKQVSAIALRAAREAVRENAFKAALESLQTVVNAYGESAEITTAMQDVERQRSTHAAEVIRQSIESARSALLKKDPSGALEVLKTAAPFLEFADAQKQAELQRIGLSVKKALRQAGANTTPSVFDRQPIAQTNRRRIAVWAGIGAVVLAVGVITAVRLARPKTQFQIPKLPLNAIVRVDGVQQKVRLDGSIIAAVKPGIREISIIAPGCDNFVDSIQVEAGRALVDPVKLTCGIVPENQGTLTIPSILPADLTKVRAFVDGQSKGILTAGQSLRLDAGEHHLIYRADGYQDSKDHVVAISKGSVASDPVILEKVPAQSGTLLVHLQNGVTIARMYVNGRSKGEVRSGSRVSLAPATYNLRFESLGCASYEMPEINIDNATETPVDVTCIKVAGASGTLRANVDSVQRGSSFTLIWETQNAKSLQISGVGPVASPSGSRQITPTGPTTYVLTSNGQELAKYAIQVTEPPPPVKVAMFEVSPRSITAGESVNVTWHIENATSVQIPGLGPGNQAAQGTMNVPLTKTTTFQLVVNGQPLAQQSVEVHEAAPPSQKLGDAGGAGGTRPTLMTAEDLKPALRTYQSLLHSAPGKNCKEILAGAKLNATAQNTLNELARNWCSEAKSFTVEEKCAAQPGGSADAPTLSCQETIQVRPKDGESFPIVAQKVFQLKKTSEGHYKLSGW
jgi:serine/threonine-protein kinase